MEEGEKLREMVEMLLLKLEQHNRAVVLKSQKIEMFQI